MVALLEGEGGEGPPPGPHPPPRSATAVARARGCAAVAAALLLATRATPAGAEDAGPPPSVAQPPLAPPPGCARAHALAQDWATRAYRDARASVVRIDTFEGHGTGFLVFTSSYVATAFHVIDAPRPPITVTAADGSSQKARVVVTDKTHDVAILELEHPFAAPPLVAETQAVEVGDPVLAVGHPLAGDDPSQDCHVPWGPACKNLKGLLYWSATQGIISNRNDDLLQTDAPINPGNSGGPLLSCNGRVLGVVSATILGAAGLGFVVPMKWVEPLRRAIGTQPDYLRRWTADLVLGVPVQIDRSYVWVGGELGVSAVASDTWSTEARLGLLWAVSTPGTSPLSTAPGSSGPVVSSEGFRVLGEIDETYRVILLRRRTPLYFLAGLGGAVAYDRYSQTTLGLTQVTPGCTGASGVACQHVTSTGTHQSEGHLWPMVTAGFSKFGFGLTYAFQLNVDPIADSTHRVLVSFEY